jgi:hypothetical protein
MKINSAGDTLWKKDFGFMDTLNINSVEETNDSGLILSATKGLYFKGQLIKTNSSGDIQWVKDLPSIFDGRAIQTHDYGFAIAASYFSVIKTDSMGNTLCTSLPGSVITSMTGLDQKYESINVQNDSLPFPVMGFYSPLDMNEVMICLSLGTNHPKINESLIEITPNPSVNSISIRSQTKLIRNEIYNPLGILVQKSDMNNLKELEINISDLSPSTYFIKIYYKEGTATLKFLKIAN